MSTVTETSPDGDFNSKDFAAMAFAHSTPIITITILRIVSFIGLGYCATNVPFNCGLQPVGFDFSAWHSDRTADMKRRIVPDVPIMSICHVVRTIFITGGGIRYCNFVT